MILKTTPPSLLILDRLQQVLSKLDDFSSRHSCSLPVEAPEPEILSASPNTQPSQSIYDSQDAHGIYDDQKIPCTKASPDSILQWPIFEGQFPPNYIIDEVFLAEMPEDRDMDVDGNGEFSENTQYRQGFHARGVAINEDATTGLVQRFLHLVHIKNPILDPDTLWSYVRHVTEDGFQWDPPSCLVLLACALGSVSEEYGITPSLRTHQNSLEERNHDLSVGEKYFNLAQRRLGLLGKGILTPQCHFLAGVYLMYTQRPLSAWSEFDSASKSYHIYLQCRSRQSDRPCDDSPQGKRRRGLEQRLYWSCYKSECELRSQIELPNSSLADFQYPDLLPSPPELPLPHAEGDSEVGFLRPHGSPTKMKALDSQRQHEQSWFYYLTEITLRRITNRVLNMLYSNDSHGLTEASIPFMTKAVNEIEQQLQQWHAGLPAPIQYTEGVTPDEELPCMVHGRVLEIKFCLFRPFLQFAIHQPQDLASQRLICPYVEKAIWASLMIVRCINTLHRHHGTWFGLRICTAASLAVLGAVRCGKIDVPQGWQGDIRGVMEVFRYWEAESPGLSRAIEVIEAIMDTVRARV
ncbi:unnamed protein product [Clonostachys solani]|uniref:Xylanolytic transcriptional activator regulatory domain-containing protein n=1 Tax=Clonostachys solani TaxID=160281 RepID=A0A9N9ZA49_9HYPO|nr:unnamed protein product [Clonostachys solani]